MKTYKCNLAELSLKTFSSLEKESSGSLLALLTHHPDWEGVWRYNEFAQQIVAVDPPMKLAAESGSLKNHDIAAVKTWLNALPKEKRHKEVDEEGNETWKVVRMGRKASSETITEAITLAAHHNTFHPVRDYLDSLAKPTVEQAHATLDSLVAVLGIDDELQWIKRQLVAAVKRVREPGCKHDYVVTLIGEQGLGKSTFVKALFDPWFQDNLPDLASKQAANALRGYWGIELAELEKVLRADDATAKAFMSRSEDVFDQKYEADTSRFPRQCVFWGTSNIPDCLRDTSGNRRYWPLKVEKHIDTKKVASMRDELWAAANVLAEDGFRTWMTPEEEVRASEIRFEYTDLDPWHTAVREFCTGKEKVTVQEVWEWLATTNRGKPHEQKGEISKLGKAERNRIGGTLRQLGCKRSHGSWIVPEELQRRIPQEPEVRKTAWQDLDESLTEQYARNMQAS